MTRSPFSCRHTTTFSASASIFRSPTSAIILSLMLHIAFYRARETGRSLQEHRQGPPLSRQLIAAQRAQNDFFLLRAMVTSMYLTSSRDIGYADYMITCMKKYFSMTRALTHFEPLTCRRGGCRDVITPCNDTSTESMC